MSLENPAKIRVRFPPSPTGPLHLGGGRTALFNWLFARKHNGTFVFRIEDTDKERSKKEYEEAIIEAINWLGLDWDEGLTKEEPGKMYRQSERGASYRAYLEKMIQTGHAYWCYCSKEDLEAEKQLAAAEGKAPRYAGHCRNLKEVPSGKKPEVIRFKTPEALIKFDDLIRGHVKFDSALLDDFVIAKDLDNPLYNFAVVIDDFEMGITHVIRGEEHISNTPRQILMQQALGLPLPVYAHLPLVLNDQRAKLSKRNADVALLAYRDKGYLPQAMVNYLVLLGWHPQDNREIFTLEELVPEFDLERVQKAGAIWSEEKLNWVNREHIKRLSTDDLALAMGPFLTAPMEQAAPEMLHAVLEAVRERLTVLSDFAGLASFFFELPEYPKEILIWKKGSAEESKEVLQKLAVAFSDIHAFDAESLPQDLAPLTEKYGRGNVLWPLRVALSGQEASPDPYTIAAILGRDEVLRRINIANEKL